MPIKHKHQSALPSAGYDVDVPQWNDNHVIDTGGTNGQAIVRDTTNADGWKWGDVAALNSPVMTGTPAAPTAPPGTNNTQIATTAFVQTAAAPPTWVAVAYNAANYVGTGTMNWVVEAGDQVRYSYLLSGKTMTVSFWVNTTTLSGTATNEIRLIIPAGKTSAAYAAGIVWMSNPASQLGIINAPANQIYLQLYKADQSNYTLGTNTWTISGTFTFEVN